MGVKYLEVNAKDVKVGDYLTFGKGNIAVTDGIYYEITGFGADGSLRYVDDAGYGRNAREGSYEFKTYQKVAL